MDTEIRLTIWTFYKQIHLMPYLSRKIIPILCNVNTYQILSIDFQSEVDTVSPVVAMP